jgi:hypothetical protein
MKGESFMRTALLAAPAVLLSLSLSFAAQQPPPKPTPVVREQKAVAVGNQVEQWRLEWTSSPSEICMPGEGPEDWQTCPCWGFRYGEMGDLDLVRTVKGKEIERVRLNQFFAGEEDWIEEVKGKAVLQHWPVSNEDYDAEDNASKAYLAAIRKRPPVNVMVLGDYDHDGRATEFFLQVSAGPCGHTPGVVIGVSKSNPRLHALTTVEAPKEPLVMGPEKWEQVRAAKGKTVVVLWACGDHGAEAESTMTVWFDKAGMHGVEETHDCPP